MQFDHYEPVPQAVADEVISQNRLIWIDTIH
jgi:translation elongation factor EF-G